MPAAPAIHSWPPRRAGRLPLAFYRRGDVVRIARELLGAWLFTRLPVADGEPPVLCGGLIVETEAYAGPEDRASHAFGNRRTARTEIMFRSGGVAYVFRCYGLHDLFNVVTNQDGRPHAVLIRGLQPMIGVDAMVRRRGKARLDRTLTAGPGALAQALGIRTAHSGCSLRGPAIWLEDGRPHLRPCDVLASRRVGVEYAGAHARRPWRFRVRHNPWTSRPD